MKVRVKNSIFQSCRYCLGGGSVYRIDSGEGIYYVCEGHKEEKDLLRNLPVDGVEENLNVQKIGIIRKVIKYIKGG